MKTEKQVRTYSFDLFDGLGLQEMKVKHPNPLEWSYVEDAAQRILFKLTMKCE